MKNKKVVVIVAALIVITVAAALIGKTQRTVGNNVVSAKAKPISAAQKNTAQKSAAAPKVFSKDAGGLTVKIQSYKGADMAVSGSVFMLTDPRSGLYLGELTSGRMRELPVGTYDVVMNTSPRMIHKGIVVSSGRETVKDLGRMGAITVKMLNSKRLPANCPVKVFSEKISSMLASGATNRTIDIIPGTYRIRIETTLPIPMKSIRVDPGKESVDDIGCVTGSITAKVVDENGKEVRSTVIVRKAGDKDVAASGYSNSSIEIAEGAYDVEAVLKPSQTRAGVKVAIGTDSAIEFTAVTPAVKPVAQKNIPSGKPAK